MPTHHIIPGRPKLHQGYMAEFDQEVASRRRRILEEIERHGVPLRTEPVDVVYFDAMSIEDLARVLRNSPLLVKPLLSPSLHYIGRGTSTPRHSCLAARAYHRSFALSTLGNRRLISGWAGRCARMLARFVGYAPISPTVPF